MTLLAAVACLASSMAQGQSLSGYRYSLRLQTDSKEQHVALVRDAGDRARYDLETSNDYLLTLDVGKRFCSVHPRDRDYNETADTGVERVIGKALRAVSSTGLVEFNLKQLDVRTRLIGPGGMVAGRTTQHYRMTQDFTVAVRALGHEGDDVHQIVVIDYWVDPTLHLTPNPLLELLSSAQSALAQQSREFQEKTAAARTALFKGVPLRMVMTSVDLEHKNKEQQSLVLQVEGLEKATFDRAVFEIPDGYRRESGDFRLNLGGGS